ncbi:MAG TPA: PQQ-binding-like beta-propeller repeat protein [Pirellulales bacterium]|jgi:outer membrane protein assembly factor BamB|nr:PQQ-binding-like beta-propeller repeat protein [Pirellulales bacterium]
MPTARRSLCLGFFLLLPCAPPEASGDWRAFRGNETTGAAAEAALPVAWDEGGDGQIAWTADLPGRGVSSPIVVGDLVVVTASSGFKNDRLHVLAFDAASGRRRWERQIWATGRTLCHPTMAVAAPTPASDGRHIVAFYSSNDLLCLDPAGNLVWLRGLGFDCPTAANDVGMASSPILVDDTVVVQVENLGDSFAAGIDVATGLSRWRHDRARAMNWASPALYEGKQRPVVLLQSPGRLTAHDPQSGRQLWEHVTGCAVIPSVVADQEHVYLPAGGLTALRISAGGKPEVAWQENKLAPANASPIVAAERVYTINGAPALTCASAATGEVLWRVRLTGAFWGTPLVAGEHLYCVSDKGLAQVVRLGTSGKVVSQFDFAEPILASPAASDGDLYFRSDAHLWKISRK